MKKIHNQRLEGIINTSMGVAEEYLREGEFEACKLLTENSMDLYNSFNKKYKLDNNELIFRLMLGHIKLVSLDKLREYGKSIEFSPHNPPSGESYDSEISREINESAINYTINMFLFNDIKPNYGLRLKPAKDLDSELKRYKLSTELRGQFTEWFEYLHVLKVYIDTFSRGRLMTDEERKIFEKFKQKFSIAKKEYLPKEMLRELPEPS